MRAQLLSAIILAVVFVGGCQSIKHFGGAAIGGIYDVRKFGARGDGRAIDSIAINKALNAQAWLCRIALNVVRNHVRTASSRPLLAGTDAALMMVPASGRAPDSAVETEWLASRVASLPPAQREAVVLVSVQGYPYADAAELVGRPVNTVKSDVHRGLAALRQMLEREEVAV